MRTPPTHEDHVGKDGELFPPGRRREAVEVEDGDAVHGDFADLDHAPQVDQGLVIDLVLSQQFGVVAEVAQEPAQLPHCPGCAVEAPGHETPGQMLGLEDGEADLVIRFLLVPAILGPIHPDQEDPVRNRVNGRHVRRAERLEIAPHAAPSLFAGIAVELAEQGIAVFLGPVGQVGDEGFDLLAGGFAEGLVPQKSTA